MAAASDGVMDGLVFNFDPAADLMVANSSGIAIAGEADGGGGVML